MSGEWVWAVVAVLAVALVAVLLWATRRRPVVDIQAQVAALAQQVGQLSQLLSGELRGLSDQVGRQLTATAELLQRQEGTLGERLSAVQGVVADVRERLGALAEAGRRLTELAQDLASLQEILRAPKSRGAFGEWLLSDLLAEVLPRERVREQYAFKGGEAVDAAIFLEGMIVPVDAKFPLSGFERLAAATTPDERRKHKRALVRDAQKHVDQIAQKYIRPDEGTADFALMYIPAEGVYHELLTPEGEDLDFLAYAWARRVVPCSPNSFYSYLRSVAMGLKGLALARNVQVLFGELRGIEDLLGQMARELATLGSHIKNARGKHEELEGMLRDVQGRLGRLAERKEAG
ncbi:MAG: DNA recombination protein RmuC [Candidatus Acetothermia bacterium]|jgi:DNA recombination protein RmuC|nr:DNA recombination protein RmuC [Candidatus Acetothermia bacterium]